jgi:hypothetical protein
MNNLVLCAWLMLAITILMSSLFLFSITNVSNELLDLNSKIDKIIIFLDLDLNAEDEVEE